MAQVCCQIWLMVLIMPHGQGHKKGAGLIFTKQLESCQSLQRDGHFLGTITQGRITQLDEQLRFDPVTGEILEFYQMPTGKTDAIAAQHDVDYSVCGNNRKCKNKADRKMVKLLDAVPWNERQYGHWIARKRD